MHQVVTRLHGAVRELPRVQPLLQSAGWAGSWAALGLQAGGARQQDLQPWAAEAPLQLLRKQ